MDEQTRKALIEFATAIETAASNFKETIANQSFAESTETDVKEDIFEPLKFEKHTSPKLGEYETASKAGHNELYWNQAFRVLAKNNSAISNRYHGAGYAHSYWLYGENQDRIYRQKLKQQGE